MSLSRYPGIILVVLSLGIASCGQEASPPAATTRKPPTPPATATSVKTDPVQAAKPSDVPESIPKAEDPDAKLREAIVGVWKQKNTGIRWLRIRPDGTGTMYIDPDWIAQAIIGDSLTVQIEWRIKDGRAIMNSVSGTPASAFEAVTTLFGDEKNRTIVTLNGEQFVLRDEEDGSVSKWTRVEADTTLPQAIAEG